MKEKFYNAIIVINKKISARNKYYTNIIYSCSRPDSISNKIIAVAKITL